MGVGKTTICQELKRKLDRCVFLDGDWCWDADPFQVNEETKEMVMRNISYLLNQFLQCSAYENIVFCWVMHEQSIIDDLLSKLNSKNCQTRVISLMCSKETITERIKEDIKSGIRTNDVLERSMERISLYQTLDTIKVNTDDRTINDIADEIMAL